LSLLAVLVICLPSLVGSVRPVHADSLPDLTVDSIWFEEASTPGQAVTVVAPGDQFLIVASIKNLGSATASGYYLDVYYDSDYGRGGPDNIAPGEAQIWYVGALTAVAGTHTTKWIVDPNNQIVESNEGNNELDYTFTIGSQTTNTTTTTTTTTSTTSSQVPVSITVTPNPAGSIVVDGTTYTSSQTFNWVPGSSHTLAANSAVPGAQGIQYVWTSWADGGDQSRTIATPSSPTTYTANYQTQYQITYSQTGCSLSTSLPATEWVNAGDSAVGTFPPTVTSGDGKTQCVLQSGSAAGPVSAPTVRAGTYKTQWQVSSAVNPSAGGAIIVNGQPSAMAWYDDGAMVSVQANANAGYAFSSWSSDATSITFLSSSSASTNATIHGAGTITASFLLKDTTPPVITATVTPSANGNGWNNGSVTVTWSVSDPESGIASSNGCTATTLSTETPPAGTTPTCTATNGAGLTNSASVTVKIDLTAPTLKLPVLTVEATGLSGASGSYDASASDSLSGVDEFSCTPASGSTFPLGTTTVSCSATDKAGNTASGTFAVTVQEKTAPVVTVPSDMTVEATGPSGAVVKFSASASDVVDGAVTPSCSPASGSTFAIGSTKVTCSATDKAGNSGSASFDVNVVDKTPPTLTLPSDMSVQATSSSGAVVTFSVSASDLVDGSVPVTCAPASGSTFSVGTTEVTCSATDKAGNSASGTFAVTVQQITPPVVTVPADMTVDATGPSGAVVTFTASASDAVDGSLTPTCTPSSGSTFALGSTSVSCTVVDKAGMTGSASFKVTVVDKTPPTITVPADMTVPATSSSGAVAKFTVSASDLVDGSVPVTCTPASGSTFPLGTTTVSCSAKDKAGNVASASFKVTVSGGVIVTLLSSSGKGLSGAVVKYYKSGWKSFGTTGSDGTARMILAAGTYNFQITYAGASQQKSQNVGTNPNVVFQTTLVTMKLLSSTNTELNGVAQYYAGGWKTFGGGTTTTSMELLPLTYSFQITYAGASQQKSQDVSKDPNVKFQTVLVSMKLVSSAGNELNGGAQYNAGGMKTFGTGTTTTSMELLPLTYTFQITYAGASQQVSQNVANSPSVVFKTTLVTMKIQSSTNTELNGTAQYNAGGWKTFGGGTTTTSMELLPLTYSFQVSYAGASKQVSQNVAANANVIFKTVQVHSDSGKCTSYYAGGSWRTFTQDVQLLPGTYKFRFSDGTRETSYTLVVGAVKHIH
jgi:hypothetical protein